MSLEQFQRRLQDLATEDLIKIFLLLLAEPTVHRDEKLDLLLKLFENTQQLESLGAILSARQFVQVLSVLIERNDFQKSLPHLLAGLPESSFSSSLNYLDAAHLDLLKHKSLLEPLQYHLMQVVHEGESLFEKCAMEIEKYQIGLKDIQVQDLSCEDLQQMINLIDEIRIPLLDYLERTNAALSIAWGTEQVDLIEKLSTIHERVHNLLAQYVGHRSSDLLPRTGLYRELHTALSNIFDTALKDEDRSVEGLTRLRIWHLQDYWDLGLLPQISNPRELDLDSDKTADKLNPFNHSLLFSQIQKQLELLKIGTIGDLKRENLFSKSLLRAYIAKNRHLLMI